MVRLCSVFEPPDAVLAGHGRRFDPIGGMQTHAAHLTRALDRRGVRQVVITTRPPGAPARDRMGERAEVWRFGLPVPVARQLYAPPAAAALMRAAAQGDVIHAHLGEDLAALPAAVWAARRHSVPLVVTVHLSLRHTFSPDGPRSTAFRALGALAERWGLRYADRVIALTPRLAALMVAAGLAPERIRVIPSGVDSGEWRGDPRDPLPGVPRPRLVFVGRLVRQKGVRTLVAATRLLSRRDAHLVLVGDGPEGAALEAAARDAGLAGRLHITGFRPHREIPAYLRHGDVFVLPSIYEELGSALLEAMRAGLPIVATCAGGIPDAVGDAALLVAPGDSAALAAAVDGLLGDRSEAVRLGGRGRERARRYEWEDLSARVLETYLSCASS